MKKDLTKVVLPSTEAKQVKKQVYKNWKLYAATLGIVTIGLSVGLGVGLGGITGEQAVVKKDLNKLNLDTTIVLEPDTTIAGVQSLFDEFLKNNPEFANDLKNNVDLLISEYQLPNWGVAGYMKIAGKGQYKGTITITFPAWPKQVALNTLNATAITGIDNMTEEDAFNVFISNNQDLDLSDLRANVNLLYTAPDYENLGLLRIIAKPNTKYIETINIPINILSKKNFDELNLNTTNINGIENMTKADAFAAFLRNNQEQELSDLRANVNLLYTAPDYKNFGSLVITPTEHGKYRGQEIVIVINPITDQQDLSSLDLILNSSFSFLNQKDAFNAFLTLNQEKYPDLKNNVEAGVCTIGYTKDSSLEIKGLSDDNKYIGTVEFIFAGLGSVGQTNLNSIIDNNYLIDGTENMTSETVLKIFLDANKKQYSDLRDNVEITNFVAPNYDDSGSVTIAARTDIDNKYTGNITIVINKISQQALASLPLILDFGFDDDQWRTETEIFEQFIKLNQDLYPDLNNNVTIGVLDKNSGTLEIKAKPGTKYSGSVIVNFSAHIKTNLNDLGLKTSLVNSEVNTFYVDQDMAFNAFINLNSDIIDLRDNVEITNFVNSEYNDKHGSLTIAAKADGKYTGEITIDLDSVTTPLNLSSFNDWNLGAIEVTEDTESAITDFVMNKIDQLIKPTLADGGGIGVIKLALSISVDANHTSITLTPNWVGQITGKIIGSGTIYFTVKVVN